MQTRWVHSLMLAGATLAGVALGQAPVAAQTQEAPPSHVRGTLTAVEGDRLTVDTRGGETLEVVLGPEAGVYVAKPATLDDIKEGSYVGFTSVEGASPDRREGLQAHVFSEDLRGLAEGYTRWDLVDQPNTMTNATVAEVMEMGEGLDLKVRFLEGEGEQKTEREQMVRLLEDIPVARIEKAPSRDVLQPGARVFMIVRGAGTPEATALGVVAGGPEGAEPPM